jgi:predicted metal-dependent peptidase
MALSTEEAIKKCRDAIMVLGTIHPHFLVIHARIRNLYQIAPSGDESVKTMGITSSGRIIMSSDFIEKITRAQLAGVLCHEMLHLVLMHHQRSGGRDQKVWNIAADMCINNALKLSNIDLPSFAFYPPPQYTGDLYVETLYEWLQKNKEHLKEPMAAMAADGGQPGAGCAVIDDGKSGFVDENGNTVDWRIVAAEATAAARDAGRDASAIARLLEDREPKNDWRRVIRKGVSVAVARPGRDIQTMARRNRRSPPEGIQYAGWRGLSPKVCVIVDVSGSMNPQWVEQVLAECKQIMKQFSGISLFFVSHTSRVEWGGWVTPTTTGKMVDAVQATGGTDPEPAYALAREQGMFDTIIHFTDGVFFTPKWPEHNGRQLIVGLYDSSPTAPPPPGSIVIPCHTE